MSFIDDLRDLDQQNPGTWPGGVKLATGLLIIALIAGLGWYLKISKEKDVLAQKVAEENSLFQTFEEKHRKAARLEEYEQQLEDMKEILRGLLRQLPSQTEIPSLLRDVSQTASATGIEVELFRPQAEIKKEFYAEKPISLRMVGNYHQFGEFVSGVASLARVVILTMHDIGLEPINEGRPELVLEGTVKTYRYLDESEQGGEL